MPGLCVEGHRGGGPHAAGGEDCGSRVAGSGSKASLVWPGEQKQHRGGGQVKAAPSIIGLHICRRGGRRESALLATSRVLDEGAKQGEKLKTMQALDTAEAKNILKTTC